MWSQKRAFWGKQFDAAFWTISLNSRWIISSMWASKLDALFRLGIHIKLYGAVLQPNHEKRVDDIVRRRYVEYINNQPFMIS